MAAEMHAKELANLTQQSVFLMAVTEDLARNMPVSSWQFILDTFQPGNEVTKALLTWLATQIVQGTEINAELFTWVIAETGNEPSMANVKTLTTAMVTLIRFNARVNA